MKYTFQIHTLVPLVEETIVQEVNESLAYYFYKSSNGRYGILNATPEGGEPFEVTKDFGGWSWMDLNCLRNIWDSETDITFELISLCGVVVCEAEMNLRDEKLRISFPRRGRELGAEYLRFLESRMNNEVRTFILDCLENDPCECHQRMANTFLPSVFM